MMFEKRASSAAWFPPSPPRRDTSRSVASNYEKSHDKNCGGL